MINIIKASLWGVLENRISVKQEDFDELNSHSLIALPAQILPDLEMADELRTKWNDLIIKQIAYYIKYQYLQDHLPITVPYVVLKGTSAAQYYPYPELRAMGDIDIITRREDYENACNMLLNNGYKEITTKEEKERTRQRSFIKDGIVIEMHSFFASINDPVTVKRFDDLIIENIQSTHRLPDLINGLVLIEHINQHLENGLGLRQIIDWMMFVDRILSDEKWPEFQKYVREVGLEKLAIVTTRMCEVYLGLPEHQWCKNANIKLSKALMDYILACGNFGYKLKPADKAAVGRTVRLRHPFMLMKDLQTFGLKNWEGAKKSYLKPFAWIWQAMQYIKDTPHLLNFYSGGRRLDALFDSLGVKREHRGLVYYENGKYIKKKK